MSGGGVWKNGEKAIFSLRELYHRYGYSLYRVSKFEEYDLYAHNKNFLISQNILTFTDTNGKLLALKPDVTLSIIKNIIDLPGVTYKLCYNENVYRTSQESDGFREIMQTGLECIGQVDRYTESEVILLAMKSLETISKEYILDLTHRGIIDGLMDQMMLDPGERTELVRLMESKNLHAIRSLCREKEIAEHLVMAICSLTELYAPIAKALPILSQWVVGEKMTQGYQNLEELCDILTAHGVADSLYLDFSIVSDVNYYDGISFKGFVNGIPESVLSGGRYDRLLARLGKKSQAIGFAVYLDRLERLENGEAAYDVDAVLLYDQSASAASIEAARRQLTAQYATVMVAEGVDPSLHAACCFKLTEGGVIALENHD